MAGKRGTLLSPNTGFIRDPHNLSSPCNSSSPLLLGLYVDNFVYFSNNPKVEKLFEHVLPQGNEVEFMGLTEWFLGIHFSRHFTNSDIAVHLNQSGYAANLVEQISWDSWDPTPTATPYCPGVPINSIAPFTNEDTSPAQLHLTEAYQSLIGSIGWLTTAMCYASGLSYSTLFPIILYWKAILRSHACHTIGSPLHPFNPQSWDLFFLDYIPSHSHLSPLSGLC